jgi:hypothetical protein
MAQFPKVNPAIDGNAGAFFGKAIDGIELNFGANGYGILTSTGPLGAWPAVIQTVEQVATIEVLGTLTANLALISANGANSNVGVRMFTSGVNAANVANLQTAIQSLGTYVVGNATVGFSNVYLGAVTASNFVF